jgi:hypothetical protein
MFTHTTSWSDAAQHPDGSVPFALPGGASCELRYMVSSAQPLPGAVAPTADQQAVQAVRDYLQSGQALADADIEGTLQENRTDQNRTQDGDGNQVPFGPSTENDNADLDYDLAVKEAVHEAIWAHLDALGLSSAGIRLEAQEMCGAAQ